MAPENFADPWCRLGVDRTIDFSGAEHWTKTFNGAAVDGDLFCPCAPNLTGLGGVDHAQPDHQGGSPSLATSSPPALDDGHVRLTQSLMGRPLVAYFVVYFLYGSLP